MTNPPLTFKTREEAMKYFVKFVPVNFGVNDYIPNRVIEVLEEKFTQWLTDEKVIIKEERK